MAVRWVALAIILLTIVFVGVFVGAVLRPPAAVTSSSNGQVEDPRSRAGWLTGRAGDWTVAAEIAEGAAGAVEIVLSVADVKGRRADSSARPQAVLRMVDMAMGAQPISLEQDASGLWRGSGNLTMGGRWSLQVSIDGARVSLPFEARPR